MAKPTQKQIAELSGVSQSVVSKVLRGNPPRNMSKAKIKAVHDAAEQLGYKRPEQTPQKPPVKPKSQPMPKFGATPQGNPLHQYGSKWNQHVANATGVMPKGDFTSLKYNEQKQVMRILNNIDKDGKKRTELTKKNYKLNETSRKVWKGVAVGAGAVGVPLTIAGLMSKLTDLIGDTANVARQGATLSIDPDKLVAMSRKAEVYGAQGEEFTQSLRSIQTYMTNMRMGISNELMNNLAKYTVGANVGRLQNIANKGTATDFIKELYRQMNEGRISKNQMVEFLGQSGAGGLTELFTNKKLPQVLNASPIEGAAQAAIELDTMLGELRLKFEDIFIKNFPAINAGLERFSEWLDRADFKQLTSMFGDLTKAITFVVSNIPGFETTSELLDKRQKLVNKYDSMQYVYSKIKDPTRKQSYALNFSGISKEIADLNQELRARGINPQDYSNAAKQSADNVASQSGRVEHVHRFELDISANTSGNLTSEQMDALRADMSNVIERYMKADKIKIAEKYQ